MSSSPEPRRLRRIRASALWAACGDALGFITELADTRGVARRGVDLPVRETVPWRRRVGGRFGPTVELPAGCVSDDTQLRLATSRSIRGDGVFDAETFAKVELPVWLSYALGAGRGSRDAGGNLRRREVTWATNFFSTDRSTYVNGGGNGAAMRIQPHVWGSPRGAEWKTDVIVNAVATHGHMRGVLGALFHAACLDRALNDGKVPGPDEWREDVSALREAASLVRSHDLLEHLWLGLWEKQSSVSLEKAIEAVVAELHGELEELQRIGTGVGGYEDAVEALGAFRPEQRGSGTKTALLAAVAAWLFKDKPADVIGACSNRLGTDTDSIATMAGALAGATVEDEPDLPLVERPYIIREAERLWAISEGLEVPSFPYPSIMTWTPPRSQIDCVGTVGKELALAGLGPIQAVEEIPAGSGKTSDRWSWGDLWFGQRVLLKHRPRPKSLPESQIVNRDDRYINASLLDAPPRPVRSRARDRDEISVRRQAQPPTLHQITDEVIATGFDPTAVGHALISLAERDDGIEAAGQYASIISKALLSRRDRHRPS
ncbi:MAG TPA: ADP-ribosylglycohydrolase family protein [Solirubrobacterales bacterium]|nr:ADP-ribosylglycohydrolase family protein [Solirubrobacterales bacterium]